MSETPDKFQILEGKRKPQSIKEVFARYDLEMCYLVALFYKQMASVTPNAQVSKALAEELD